MPFPDVERVIYKNNPLIEVVCQLRFPRILSINETAPATFQDHIRQEYPVFNTMIEQQQQLALEAESFSIPRVIQTEANKNYRFSSEDGAWHVNLTSTFLSLSTSQYTRWEEFFGKLSKPIHALLEIYKPAFYERIGLRYVDAFTKSKLGLGDVDWSELINPFALGFLSNNEIKDEIRSYSSVAELDIGDKAIAQIRTVLGFVGTTDPLNYFNHSANQTHSELSLIIDSDMFYLKKSLDESDSSLEYLHSVSSKLIRAIITEKLHNSMGPTSI